MGLFMVGIGAAGCGFLQTVGILRNQDGKVLYLQAQEMVRNGDLDQAFMYFRSITEQSSDPEYIRRALFSLAEYYYLVGDSYDASRRFLEFVEIYPEATETFLAYIYLWQIAHHEQKYEQAEQFKTKLVSMQQLNLIFREFKKIDYTSGFLKKYRLFFYIDRLELYIHEELFAELSF